MNNNNVIEELALMDEKLDMILEKLDELSEMLHVKHSDDNAFNEMFSDTLKALDDIKVG